MFNKALIISILYCIFFKTLFLPCFYAMNFNPYGSFEYYVEQNESVQSYVEAETRCSRLNASLAVIRTMKIEEFLVNEIGNISITGFPYSYFIGLIRTMVSNEISSFEWIDNTQLEGSYTNWHKDEPNNIVGDEYCVTMGSRYTPVPKPYQWFDAPCNNWSSYYICQRSFNFTPTTEINPTERNSTDVVTSSSFEPLNVSFGQISNSSSTLITSITVKERRNYSSPILSASSTASTISECQNVETAFPWMEIVIVLSVLNILWIVIIGILIWFIQKWRTLYTQLAKSKERALTFASSSTVLPESQIYEVAREAELFAQANGNLTEGYVSMRDIAYSNEKRQSDFKPAEKKDSKIM